MTPAANTLPTNYKKKYSNLSSHYFFEIVENIGKSLEPTDTQLDRLTSAYNSTGDYLANCDEFDGSLIEIYAQGSRALGTIVRPLNRNHGFDIDLIARFSEKAKVLYSDQFGPKRLLTQLKIVLQRYAQQHQLQINADDRCITLEYVDGMRADIAPVIDSPRLSCIYGDTYGLIPDRNLHKYYDTNPKGFTSYFNQIAKISPIFTSNLTFAQRSITLDSANIQPLPVADKVFSRLLCRIVQLLKIHRDISFSNENKEYAPSSILITALVTKTYSFLARQPHETPLDLVLNIVDKMPYFIEKNYNFENEEWFLENPSVQGDNFASSLNTTAMKQAFTQWNKKLLLDLENILQTIERKEGIDRVNQLIEHSFGTRAANIFLEAQRNKVEQDRGIGRTAIITSSSAIIPLSSRAHSFYGN